MLEGLRLIERVGVDAVLAHSLALGRRLLDRIDPDRYRCISPHVERSPILTFEAREPEGLRQRLAAAGVVVALLGEGRFRVSPGLYNDASDVDRLAEFLDAGP